MLDVTVKRSEWGRGGYPSIGAHLYNPQTRKRCCLGFVGNACGITDKQMAGVPTPASLYYKSNLIILDSLLGSINTHYNSEIGNELMLVNDRGSLSETERESKLTELGQKVGINFTFVD